MIFVSDTPRGRRNRGSHSVETCGERNTVHRLAVYLLKPSALYPNSDLVSPNVCRGVSFSERTRLRIREMAQR